MAGSETEPWAGCQTLWAQPAPAPSWPPSALWSPICKQRYWLWLPRSWGPWAGRGGMLGYRDGFEDRRDLPCSLPTLTSRQRYRSEQQFIAGTPHLSHGAALAPWLRRVLVKGWGAWATAPWGGNREGAPGRGQCSPPEAFRARALPGDRLEALEATRSRDL